MRAYYKEGFVLLKNSQVGPVFIAPHSTTTLSPVMRGDAGCEFIAAMLTKRMGSLGIICTVPRAGRYGVDFFRKPADMDEALEMFKAANNYKKRMLFEKKYAFYSQDQEEYLEKVNVHNHFWMAAETLAPKMPLYVIIHAQAMRLKNFPSILDVCTNDGKWFNESVVKEAVEKANKKNAERLARVKNHMKAYAVSWAGNWLRRSIGYRFKKFSLNAMQGTYRNDVKRDISNAARILGRNAAEMEKSLNWAKYEKMLEESIEATQFRITYQKSFTGKRGDGNVKKMLEKTGGSAIMFETSAFLNEMYPKTSMKLIQDVIYYASQKARWSNFEKFIGEAK